MPLWQAYTPAPHEQTSTTWLGLPSGGLQLTSRRKAAAPIAASASPRSSSAGTSSPSRGAFSPGFRARAGSSTPPTSFRRTSSFRTGTPGGTSVWNFSPQGGVGVHYFIRPRRSIDLGVNAVHISSASLGDRNPGVNASIQMQVGYTYLEISPSRRQRDLSHRGGAAMNGPVVECVPNFSEGTDARRVEAIVAAMRVEGVRLLDWSMDADHNRSVVTIAGDPAAVVEAAVRGVGKAVELIDLTRQQGVHPRIGAADVIPFVPISGIKLEQCALLARQAGLEIWRRFGVPVFFYEAAAARPDRANLEDVRRGQFEGLQRSGPQGFGAASRPRRPRPASHRRSLCRGRAQIPGGLQHLFRFCRRGHGARHCPRDSRRFRRLEGRQGHGSSGPRAGSALHEHHRLSGHAHLPGVSDRLQRLRSATRRRSPKEK